ncbi:hypothetical protein LUZ60_003753 [Juncus effusus]|nr:hypothetical protein LUZ60_003753 [Juncus effusus]
MDLGFLQRRYTDLISALFREGVLDAQFKELQQLQDESNPTFVFEVVSLFFDDAERLINELSANLSQPVVDYKKIDAHVHQLKGSSASIGAQRIKNVCIAFRDYCDMNNLEGCFNCTQQLKEEYFLFKTKLESLFMVEQQIAAAGGSIPMVQ